MEATVSDPSIASGGVLPSTAICLACGYSLAGLTASGSCPECATPIARSLRGNMLEYANRDYVTTLIWGAHLVLVGLIATIAWLVGAPILIGAFVETGRVSLASAMMVLGTTDVAAAAISLVGWWLLTSPDPALRDPSADVRVRRWLRAILLIIMATTLVGLVAMLVPALGASGLYALSGPLNINPSTKWTPLFIVSLAVRVMVIFIKLASFFVGLMYVQALAARIPDRTLHTSARRLLWLVPLLSTVGILCVVGPPLAFILYVRTLWRCSRGLKAARARMPQLA